MMKASKILAIAFLVLAGGFIYAATEADYQKVFDETLEKCAGYHCGPDISDIQKHLGKLDKDAVPFLIKKAQEGDWEKTEQIWTKKGREAITTTGKDSPFIKGVALLYLAELKDERAVEPLFEILKSEQTKIVIAKTAPIEKTGADMLLKSVIFALGELGDSRAVDPLIELYNIELIKKYQYKIINALGNLGAVDQKAVIFLLYLFEKEDRFICKALGRTKDPRAIEAIAQILEYNVIPDKYINKYGKEWADRNAKFGGFWSDAIAGLVIANTPLALDKLSKIILDPNRPLKIRDTALCVIKSYPPISREVAEKILLKALEDENGRIRYLAITALCKCKEIDGNLVLSIAQKMAKEEKNGEARGGAKDVLENLGDENTVKFLEDLMIEEKKANPLATSTQIYIDRLKKRLAKEKAAQEQEPK